MEKDNASNGYLIVRVTTAGGAIPLEDALVSIRGGTPETSGVIYTLKTDSDGRTKKVALPTPPRELSQSPGSEKAYASYNIDVTKVGYISRFFHAVPVFPDVLSIQPATLAPLPEGDPNTSYSMREDSVTDEGMYI